MTISFGQFAEAGSVHSEQRKSLLCENKHSLLRTDNVILCRNAFNVTGECLRETCPLANSYYGTIIEQEGVCYLYLKTIERAHTPRKLWEKIKLKDDETKALQQIESHMKNVYKDSQIENCQRRLLKIREYLQRMRKMALQPAYDNRQLL